MDPFHILIFVGALIGSYTLGFIFKNFLKRRKENDSTSNDGLGSVEGSILALFAFFLGFTFSISASKVETVRQASIVESNAIGTALLRTKMYNDTVADNYKVLFKGYLQSRIDYFSDSKTIEEVQQSLKTSLVEGEKIWDYTIQLQKSGNYAEQSRLMIPAVNDMIDSVTTRDSVINANLPLAIVYTLYVLSACSCFVIGFSMRRKLLENFIGIVYILVVALTVNLILDASNPRSGFINTKKANQTIVEIYNQIK